MDRQIAHVYSQSGGDLPYFVGKQYGSGWLRTLGRMAFPILKSLGSVAANTAADVLLDEKPLKESLISNATNQYGRMTRAPNVSTINVSKKRRRQTNSTTPY